MQKFLEALSSFLLFGSAATGLIMIWVLVAEYKLDSWGVTPAVILTVCILTFLLSWAWFKKLKK
ncbi:MAG: hypothetical protein ACJZ2I_02550 [Thalassobaculaceae bacterium]|jgi:hypothetical protein|nr:MAG: hypothetical protein CBC15_02370 [Candidatus Endolissoclinum sp. TMED55]|tara:strand:+ start:440 stop:631 length:192 start_codon:yes stop_codon:yes gene_type:complete